MLNYILIKNIKVLCKKIREKKLIRVILIGKTYDKKSIFFEVYFGSDRYQGILSTIGVFDSYKSKRMEDGEYIIVILFDTAGQEPFEIILRKYLNNIHGVAIFYDITDM